MNAKTRKQELAQKRATQRAIEAELEKEPTHGTLLGKRFVVVGLGKSGVGAVDLLLRRGAHVLAIDENPNSSVKFSSRHFELSAGAFPARYWEGAAAVVVSPGVPLSKPELAAARAAGVPVYGEIELAWRFRGAGAGPILGITGTNGKSTTTALLGHIITLHQSDSFVGGNLGTAFTTAYVDPARRGYAMHVVELSSFQLEGMDTAELLGSAILNLTPDHLDRYASHVDYGAAKARIFRTQPANGFAVINGDDPHVVELAKQAKVTVYRFTLHAEQAAEARATSSESFSFDGVTYRVANRALRGAHNLQNAMAAAMLASLAGVPAEVVQRGLDSFPGLPHRLEFVRDVGGVEWINDSKATNVDSSLVALNALAGRVWLIAGGKGKGAPYAPLVQAAKGKLRGVLTIGADAPAIATAFASETTVEACGTLEKAVARAKEVAVAGDTVLLSPACASYDQFDHFEHRGDTFKTLVRAL
ncbi:MAG: UDP-N-acetylmuramoyl-L-alanine--D-glutamate ligase [Archangium sp.]|nr:UDP-N-acetylmuramoyl-L-alanine--D-glutamate ligase [Archangium sp.]